MERVIAKTFRRFVGESRTSLSVPSDGHIGIGFEGLGLVR